MVAFVTALVPMPPAGAAEDALQWPESTASALRLLVAALGLYLFLRRDIGVTESRLNSRIDDTKADLTKQIDDASAETRRRFDRLEGLLLASVQDRSEQPGP